MNMYYFMTVSFVCSFCAFRDPTWGCSNSIQSKSHVNSGNNTSLQSMSHTYEQLCMHADKLVWGLYMM